MPSHPTTTSGDLLYQQVDRQRILSQGAQVMGKLLLELQVRKSTADGAGAREYYEKLTNPLPGWEGELRDLVIAKKQVRFFLPSAATTLCGPDRSCRMANGWYDMAC